MAQFFRYILELKQDTMKSMRFLVLAFGAALMVACGSSSPLGDQVKEPFSSSKYESTKRYWRAVGKGSSKDDNIAKRKADLQAKKEIAQQVQTRMKVVSDQYFSDTETLNSEEVNDKFQSLAREVTNTQIADLRKIGEEKYFNGENYTVYIAYEIHKANAALHEKEAKVDSKIDKAMLKTIEDIIDSELAELEDEDE